MPTNGFSVSSHSKSATFSRASQIPPPSFVEEKSVDQFFEELSGGEALSKEKFVGFLKGASAAAG